MYFGFTTKLTIYNCAFKNFKHTKATETKEGVNEGILFSINQHLDISFDKCTFVNIGDGSGQTHFFKMNGDSILRMTECTFTFDDSEKGSPICHSFSGDDLTFDHCTFTRAPKNMIYITQLQSQYSFVFTNNIVEGNTRQFIKAENVDSSPNIKNNVFRNINLASDYLITYKHSVSTINLINNTFSHITTGTNKYCGGISSYYQNSNFASITITYEDCKFYDNINTNTASPFNQGGALQYGYSIAISDTTLIFRTCEFKGNQCPNGNGGALGININRDLTITDCIFENNITQDKGGAIYIWGKLVKPSDVNNAPEFSGEFQMNNININNCRFIGNKCDTGSSIFIEEEHMTNVKLTISSNNFTNNGEIQTSFTIISYCGELLFDDCKIEYTDKSKTNGAMKLNKATKVTLSNSEFNNCNVESYSSIDMIEQNENSQTTITNCHFNNCQSQKQVIRMSGGSIEVYYLSILFDSDNSGSGGVDFGNKDFIIEHSTFIRTRTESSIKFDQIDTTNAGRILINDIKFDSCQGSDSCCLTISSHTLNFEIKNIIIENTKQNENTGYIVNINCNNKLDTILLDNISFINNECNSNYGGGSGLFIKGVDTISFSKCNFNKNIALQSTNARPERPNDKEYFNGDGGGLQYGFTTSLNEIKMIFKECKFENNKATRHGGAIAIQTTNTIEINKCTFLNNNANYKTTRSTTTKENYYDQKEEGRGGAIYINPTFSYDGQEYEMSNIKIIDSIFESNKAFDGYAIYIEGEDKRTTFEITNNKFINNYDASLHSSSKSVITTEIFSVYNSRIVENNIFAYTNSDLKVEPILFVDHSGNPSSTPAQSLSKPMQLFQITRISSIEAQSKSS